MSSRSIKRFLCTTTYEKIWRPKEPTLLLGTWRLQTDVEGNWPTMDHEVAAYHWGDLEKLGKDEIYCYQVYEKLLTDLALVLNNYHGIEWSP